MSSRYGIAEWFGEPFAEISTARRRQLAAHALNVTEDVALCPFQEGEVRCNKNGGVCSIQLYEDKTDSKTAGRLGHQAGPAVITCPQRFSQGDLIARWLAEIAGYKSIFLAREVPFMRSPTTGRAAGKIDMVLASDQNADNWLGLEVQAVYFSGLAMESEFKLLQQDRDPVPPAPLEVRRPDWRSSSAKRLMPQLQVKVPTLRRWGTKLAVAVDLPFFEAIGGISETPSQDLDEGDIIWLVPRVSEAYRLERGHWEVLSLEASSKKLLAAEPVKRREFEQTLRAKLRHI